MEQTEQLQSSAGTGSSGSFEPKTAQLRNDIHRSESFHVNRFRIGNRYREPSQAPLIGKPSVSSVEAAGRLIMCSHPRHVKRYRRSLFTCDFLNADQSASVRPCACSIVRSRSVAPNIKGMSKPFFLRALRVSIGETKIISPNINGITAKLNQSRPSIAWWNDAPSKSGALISITITARAIHIPIFSQRRQTRRFIARKSETS